MTGSVIEVRLKRNRGEGTQLQEQLELVAGKGIRGDWHFEKEAESGREVLLLDKSSLQSLGYDPGVFREQILVDAPDLQSLAEGTRLAVGEAELEIVMDCAPCNTLAGYVGEDGPAFVQKAMKKRGMLARVTRDGTVRAGDGIRKLADG